ncbi:hypothetical protein [Neobacillus notoginsengisoli]|uniref:hypothetical protein n=1 Tax=Neobacillus notoginsengisoli TaxID=1578198 RepID=UPI001314B56E|nr:hypothetical protein [Neobacillus notoginsengisoli]
MAKSSGISFGFSAQMGVFIPNGSAIHLNPVVIHPDWVRIRPDSWVIRPDGAFILKGDFAFVLIRPTFVQIRQVFVQIPGSFVRKTFVQIVPLHGDYLCYFQAARFFLPARFAAVVFRSGP